LVTNLATSPLNIDASDFVQIIEAATNVLKTERQTGHIIGGKIMGGVAELLTPQNLIIIGDIHGDFKSLFKILQDIAFEEFLLNPYNKIIFLGDYVDRGSNSVGVLYSICYLKQKFPNSIVLMRGNHEAPLEFPFLSHDLPFKIIEYYGENLGKWIYNKKVLPFFQLLILTTVIKNELLIVHGGLPSEVTGLAKDFRNSIAAAQENHMHNRIMEEILWNDPWKGIHTEDWRYSERGVGRLFGINVSKKWLRISGTKAVVRGHEPCQGFKIDHDGMIMTLFSCREAYPNSKAAYISISSKQLHYIHNAIDLSQYVIKIN
jgi:diadenosine tetraphosphatase ApaH/serine/threonine PP2A family protein phosphatase